MASATTVLRRGIIICANPNNIQVKDRIKLLEGHHHVSLLSATNRQAMMTDFQRSGWRKVGRGATFCFSWATQIAYYANAPISVSEPTATTTVTLVLQTIRATTQAEMSLRKGQWTKGLEATDDIRDLAVGIIGYGTIGRLVQKKLQALGVKKFFYHNRHRIPPEDENGAIYSSLDQLLSESDLVTLHCPLTPDTRHILSDEQFAKMKHGAYIVNTSRGPVIDEEALVRAMKSGQILRVGLDVFENEPKVHPYLMTSERATLLPNWGSKVKRVYYDVEHECLDNLDTWLETGVPRTPVNKPTLPTNVSERFN
ncbi:hypothetical protein OPQ81_006700 [Rhizoctonia solani]|nr:hypothetical protein OPQ81_006700 [Rhizoctonia solani]